MEIHSCSTLKYKEGLMVEIKKSYKIVMIGQSGIGKTSIVTRYDKDTFTPFGSNTIGGELVSKKEFVQLDGN